MAYSTSREFSSESELVDGIIKLFENEFGIPSSQIKKEYQTTTIDWKESKRADIVIKSKKAGIDTSDLIKETDFEDKKVRNIIYKLKKQNRIKTAKRGVYVAS
ncbi:MAG: hypothetical protein MUE70_15365 [Desulfobacterales bacterium]|nr:hypothetical protein [Desulfobacterales bacterium]